MKYLIVTLMLMSNIWAYDVGDSLSEEMVSHLELKDDKVYVVDFFASWCGSCQKELPLMTKANLNLNHDEVEIIGIDVDKDPQKAARFQEALKAEGHLNFRVINDPQNLIIAKFNPLGMPTLYYIKNKKVLKIITGAIDNIDQQIHNDLKMMR